MKTVYCVEDDQEIRDLIIYTLKASGYDGRGFSTGEELLEILAGEKPHLILLDIMLPGQDGIAILKKLKEDPNTATIPVIIASAKGAEYDKVKGLDLGADDYLAKPFGMMEMIARVRAVLRRSGGTGKTGEELTNGPIVMNDRDHLVSVDEKHVNLTLKEYEILRLFLENPGRVFTREQLLNSIWGIDYLGESRTVDVHIGTLRSKLGPAGVSIETVHGIGYRMGQER